MCIRDRTPPVSLIPWALAPQMEIPGAAAANGAVVAVYRLAYEELVGGVLNMRTEHFQRVNGYSNLYWGWGAEDDDMAYR